MTSFVKFCLKAVFHKLMTAVNSALEKLGFEVDVDHVEFVGDEISVLLKIRFKKRITSANLEPLSIIGKFLFIFNF